MKEFNYELDYKNIDFKDQRNRKLYRIGRGEQGVLLVRPYTDDICTHWRFKTPEIAVKSANKILSMYLGIWLMEILLVWICVESFWKWDLRGREDMRTITQEESIRRVREICYHRKKTTQRVNMLNPQQFSREYEILWRETIYMLK